MAGTSSAIVAGLTAAALATVGYLGHRAAETVPPDLKRQASGSPAPAPKAPRSKHPAALPPRTGVGQRVVYSLGRDRVWLVDQGDTVRRTFGVSPSTVDPAPGTYRVTSRSGEVTGSDGVPVEHVVRFASVDGTVIGFSAAVDGSAPVLDPTERTGGIRETRADGAAMWKFATIGRTVVVVP
ncbi:hypothetical protein [Streptomyces sp. XHT-2]|jgi:hypothetical protein|uniref:hypothetical protein n=1 Tax=Streptomyces sp. XHT-2 TaxID=2692621 RepID=UPI0010C09D28|nr:hypothetical protein [Streptomyces sp. XHT-2]WSB55906.1 hypothetical protein OG880_19885 [Streptomyces cellulosae]WSB86156.1 hypothetical protein OHA60_21525 [Streptomyces cellulosae]WTB70965.1 hypothetical protein OIE90_20075 [Streptomyces cellulosae]